MVDGGGGQEEMGMRYNWRSRVEDLRTNDGLHHIHTKADSSLIYKQKNIVDKDLYIYL